MRHLALNLIASAGLVLGASQARADNVDFLGFSNGSESVNFAVTAPEVPTSGAAAAGGFLTSVNGGPSFTTYCVDLYQEIAFSDPAYSGYSLVAGSAHAFANSNANTDLAKLYSAGHVVHDAVTEAAFQIAVWEIAYETTGTYNLSSGDATFTGGSAASSGALTLATSWLGALGSGNGVAINVLESAAHQDVIYPTPVPEPSTYALMIAGLMGMTFVARRRNRAHL